MNTLGRELEKAATVVRDRTCRQAFDLAVILGSGLGSLADEADQSVALPYREIPCLPSVTVPGHGGRLVSATLGGVAVLFFQGRFHLYQGLDARQVVLPVRLAHALGCRRLLLTCAAGGVNPSYRPGDFMFLVDHLNLTGDNPLRGETDDPFVDLTHLYRQDLFSSLLECACRAGATLHGGVLAALAGPSYETPAEIRMLRLLGADVVSMSTVPEAIMAQYLGLEVAGLALVANAAAGLSKTPLDHREVLDAGRRGARQFQRLVRHLVPPWPDPTAGRPLSGSGRDSPGSGV